MTELPDRPTARVLLLDARDRILLMRGRLPGRTGPANWFTIGGGLEPGEDYVQAAAREIEEETGIRDFEIGPVVWLREGQLDIPHRVMMRERYLVARCQGGEPHRGGWQALEHELIDEVRWWTQGELATTQELVFPPGLADLLPDILAGRFPEPPRRIPWGHASP